MSWQKLAGRWRNYAALGTAAKGYDLARPFSLGGRSTGLKRRARRNDFILLNADPRREFRGWVGNCISRPSGCRLNPSKTQTGTRFHSSRDSRSRPESSCRSHVGRLTTLLREAQAVLCDGDWLAQAIAKDCHLLNQIIVLVFGNGFEGSSPSDNRGH